MVHCCLDSEAQVEQMIKVYQMAYIAAGISTVLYLTLVVVLSRLMKARHNEVWKKLDSFSLFMNNSMSSTTKFLRYFIFTNSFFELDDVQITLLTFACKLLFAVCAFLFAFEFYLTMSGRV
jgi:hypothetical protein